MTDREQHIHDLVQAMLDGRDIEKNLATAIQDNWIPQDEPIDIYSLLDKSEFFRVKPKPRTITAFVYERSGQLLVNELPPKDVVNVDKCHGKATLNLDELEPLWEREKL